MTAYRPPRMTFGIFLGPFHRLEELLRPAEMRRTTVRTFHGLCARLLRQYGEELGINPGFSIYDSADQQRAMAQALQEHDLSTSNFPPARILSTVSQSKNELKDAQMFAAAATGFTYRPEGLCLDDLCIAMPPGGGWITKRDNRSYLDLSAFAAHLGQVLVRDEGHGVWSLGDVPVLRSRDLGAGLAPDFELPDRKGRPVRLSAFRGKKVLLLTWASW